MYQKRKKRGRPKKKRLFRETKVGYMIQHEAPLEYQMILRASGNAAPSPDFIEAMAYASGEPVFHKKRFWVVLREYRETKLHPPVAIKPTVKRELFYIKYRRNNGVISGS